MPLPAAYVGVAALATALAAAGCGSGSDLDLGPPMTLAPRGSSNPTVAVDARNGAAYVAWVETHDGESNVYLALADGRVTLFRHRSG
jgi:hypothetical protein